MFVCTLELRHYVQIQTNQEAEYFIIGRYFSDPGLTVGEQVTVHYPEIDENLYQTGETLPLKAIVTERKNHIYMMTKNKKIALTVSNSLKISEETFKSEGVVHLRIYLECEDRDLMIKLSNYVRKINEKS